MISSDDLALVNSFEKLLRDPQKMSQIVNLLGDRSCFKKILDNVKFENLSGVMDKIPNNITDQKKISEIMSIINSNDCIKALINDKDKIQQLSAILGDDKAIKTLQTIMTGGNDRLVNIIIFIQNHHKQNELMAASRMAQITDIFGKNCIKLLMTNKEKLVPLMKIISTSTNPAMLMNDPSTIGEIANVFSGTDCLQTVINDPTKMQKLSKLLSDGNSLQALQATLKMWTNSQLQTQRKRQAGSALSASCFQTISSNGDKINQLAALLRSNPNPLSLMNNPSTSSQLQSIFGGNDCLQSIMSNPTYMQKLSDLVNSQSLQSVFQKLPTGSLPQFGKRQAGSALSASCFQTISSNRDKINQLAALLRSNPNPLSLMNNPSTSSQLQSIFGGNDCLQSIMSNPTYVQKLNDLVNTGVNSQSLQSVFQKLPTGSLPQLGKRQVSNILSPVIDIFGLNCIQTLMINKNQLNSLMNFIQSNPNPSQLLNDQTKMSQLQNILSGTDCLQIVMNDPSKMQNLVIFLNNQQNLQSLRSVVTSWMNGQDSQPRRKRQAGSALSASCFQTISSNGDKINQLAALLRSNPNPLSLMNNPSTSSQLQSIFGGNDCLQSIMSNPTYMQKLSDLVNSQSLQSVFQKLPTGSLPQFGKRQAGSALSASCFQTISSNRDKINQLAALLRSNPNPLSLMNNPSTSSQLQSIFGGNDCLQSIMSNPTYVQKLNDLVNTGVNSQSLQSVFQKLPTGSLPQLGKRQVSNILSPVIDIFGLNCIQTLMINKNQLNSLMNFIQSNPNPSQLLNDQTKMSQLQNILSGTDCLQIVMNDPSKMQNLVIFLNNQQNLQSLRSVVTSWMNGQDSQTRSKRQYPQFDNKLRQDSLGKKDSPVFNGILTNKLPSDRFFNTNIPGVGPNPMLKPYPNQIQKENTFGSQAYGADIWNNAVLNQGWNQPDNKPWNTLKENSWN